MNLFFTFLSETYLNYQLIWYISHRNKDIQEAFLASSVVILLSREVEFKSNSEAGIRSESSQTFKTSFLQKKLTPLTIFAKSSIFSAWVVLQNLILQYLIIKICQWEMKESRIKSFSFVQKKLSRKNSMTATLIKRDSGTSIFRWILRFFSTQLF